MLVFLFFIFISFNCSTINKIEPVELNEKLESNSEESGYFIIQFNDLELNYLNGLQVRISKHKPELRSQWKVYSFPLAPIPIPVYEKSGQIVSYDAEYIGSGYLKNGKKYFVKLPIGIYYASIGNGFSDYGMGQYKNMDNSIYNENYFLLQLTNNQNSKCKKIEFRDKNYSYFNETTECGILKINKDTSTLISIRGKEKEFSIFGGYEKYFEVDYYENYKDNLE